MDMTLSNATTTDTKSGSGAARWAGRILTGLTGLFLTFDVVIKLVDHPAVHEASVTLGLPDSLAKPVALILAACLALYLAPRTAPIGAVLLTGYLGGAVLVHARVGSPLLSHTLFPIYVGAVLWTGLYLRDERVRGLIASSSAARRSATARTRGIESAPRAATR